MKIAPTVCQYPRHGVALAQVSYQSKTVFTAIFSYVLLNRQLVGSQWFAVFLLTLATIFVSEVRLSDLLSNAQLGKVGQAQTAGLCAVLGAAVLSGARAPDRHALPTPPPTPTPTSSYPS